MALTAVLNLSTLVLKMSTLTSQALGAALFGRTRRAVLGLLYSHPDQNFFLRQIARQLAISPGAVQRELSRLSSAGILQRTVFVQQAHYRANPECPIFSELKGIVLKTIGVGDVLRAALLPLRSRIQIAFLYGSLARGDWKKQSDIDLMIVGDVNLEEVVARLASPQATLQREVNPTIYSPAEFETKVSRGHHFLSSVLKAKKLFLIGDERELASLGAIRVAKQASK